MKKTIIVKLEVEGVHKWPNCNINEVDYLKNEHRHIFHITAEKEVSHNDRDVEIIKFKRQIKIYLADFYFDQVLQLLNFHSKSCEDIAEELLSRFNLESCQVLEDNENGAKICK